MRADRGLDQAHEEQVLPEETQDQAEEPRVERRAKKRSGLEVATRGDGARPLQVVQRVHRGLRESRAAPRLQDVDDAHGEREQQDREEEQPSRAGPSCADWGRRGHEGRS